MPLIHIGDITHHHDQVITPVSLSTINVGNASDNTLWAAFQHRSVADFGDITRMLNTMPA
jgi:hypothetical protein